MEYRQLREGEVVIEGDETDSCNNAWHDGPKWEKAKLIGHQAPDPTLPAHRLYRRPLYTQAELNAAVAKAVRERTREIANKSIIDRSRFAIISDYPDCFTEDKNG